MADTGKPGVADSGAAQSGIEAPRAVVECPVCGDSCVAHLHLEKSADGVDQRAWKVLTCAGGCGWFSEELFLGKATSVPRRKAAPRVARGRRRRDLG
jgi:hypothetical protein